MLIIVLAAAGLWPDPNPNPIGPDLLAFFTFWPSVICIAVGAARAMTDNRESAGATGQLMTETRRERASPGSVAAVRA